jgi:dTDP-4-dehydrorhamnose 3,5-epimerase
MLIKPFFNEDERGSFVKTFHADEFAAQGLDNDFRESFYSESKKGVIRGMHFQLPPEDHSKLVFCTTGEVLDVILDLRKDSPMFGKAKSFSLSAENRDMLYIPKGCAHGFYTVSDIATVFYFTSTVHSKPHDTGIRYDSFGFDWPGLGHVLSARDKSFITLDEFDSPF